MKKSRNTHGAVIEGQKAAAARLKTTVAEVRRAKNSGCLAFEPGNRIRLPVLRQWLRDNPRPRVTATHTADLPTGAAAALRRLEEAEARAYGLMQAATDPDARDAARREWLAVSEQLRRHDIALDMARREAGVMIPRDLVEAGLRTFLGYLRSAIADDLRAVCPRICGLPDPAAVAAVLGPITASGWQAAVDRCVTWTGQTKAGTPEVGLVIDRATVADGIAKGVATMFSELDRVFTSELPPQLEALKAPAIAAKCREAVERLKATLRTEFELLTK